jgi:hypothetical protein
MRASDNVDALASDPGLVDVDVWCVSWTPLRPSVSITYRSVFLYDPVV